MGYVLKQYFVNVLNSYQMIDGLRVAGLIAAIYYLLVLISGVSTKHQLLELLVSIRRQLGLGSMEYPIALQQVEIIVAGLKISDVLQEYVSRIIMLCDEFDGKMQKASAYIGIIEKYYRMLKAILTMIIL